MAKVTKSWLQEIEDERKKAKSDKNDFLSIMYRGIAFLILYCIGIYLVANINPIEGDNYSGILFITLITTPYLYAVEILLSRLFDALKKLKITILEWILFAIIALIVILFIIFYSPQMFINKFAWDVRVYVIAFLIVLLTEPVFLRVANCLSPD